jgi:hypothetical protein
MRTTDTILADFQLHEPLPRALLEPRLLRLASYVRDYERSYEMLSTTLQKRTAAMREAEEREAVTERDNERLKIQLAAYTSIVLAVMNWDAALGTKEETQMMADLRETLTMWKARDQMR